MKISVKFTSFILLAVALASVIRLVHGAAQRNADHDRQQALLELEQEWLKNEHDAAALEKILAADFVHPVVTGDFLNKQQHIFYSTRSRPPANLKNHFESLNARVYGDVGIVNGIVVSTDETGKEVDRTIFTDVFVYRDGHWQAINAQENKVEKLERRQ